MASISTTTLDALQRLMVPIIVSTVPRVVYQGAETWKYYAKASSAPSRTRRFTLRWSGFSGVVPGGYMTTLATDSAGVLSVVTDYAGQHENLTAMVHDDWMQLRDRMAALTADITSGLIQLQTTRTGPARVASTAHARTRLSETSAANSNTFQMNLTYDVQVHQARAG